MYIDRSCVSVSAVLYQLVCHVKSSIKVFRFVESQNRRKFLMSKWLRDIHRSHLADKNLGIFRNRNSGKLSDHGSWLSNDPGIYGAGLCKDDLADFVQFFAV